MTKRIIHRRPRQDRYRVGFKPSLEEIGRRKWDRDREPTCPTCGKVEGGRCLRSDCPRS